MQTAERTDVAVPQNAQEARALVDRFGGINAAAAAVGMPRSTFKGRLAGKLPGPSSSARPLTAPSRPLSSPSALERLTTVEITREALEQALAPVNTCPVRPWLDALSVSSRDVVEALFADDSLTHQQVMDALGRVYEQAGVSRTDIARLLPGKDAIGDHRRGRRPCRCRG